MIDKDLLNDIAAESYARCHTPAGRERILQDEGPQRFRERGIEYHGPIIRHALEALIEAGYVINKAEKEDYSDFV